MACGVLVFETMIGNEIKLSLSRCFFPGNGSIPIEAGWRRGWCLDGLAAVRCNDEDERGEEEEDKEEEVEREEVEEKEEKEDVEEKEEEEDEKEEKEDVEEKEEEEEEE
jgi:hypothetical protein